MNVMLNLDKSKKYLLACSFGPDSMALFFMLLKNNISFDVAHVNYHLRDESDFEQKSLENICEKNNIKCFVKNQYNLRNKANIEAKARAIRYNFFKDIYQTNEYEAVLVAHNQDDLIETYIMQTKRNNYVKHFGIESITKINDVPIIRPLLDYKKKDLLDYCLKNSVPFSIDQTNLLDCYLRNRIRHQIVEKLTDKQRKNYIDEINDKNKNLDLIFNKIKTTNIHLVSNLLSLNAIEFVYAINALAEEKKKDAHISLKCCLEIRKILESKKPNINFAVSSLCFVKSYNNVNFILNIATDNYCYTIPKPSKLDTPFFFLDFTGDASNRNVTIDDYPLTIRPAKSGETTIIKNYTVKIRRLYIDWKMPSEKRKKWPVIVNRYNKVIYVPRFQNNFILKQNLNFYVK